MSRNGLLQNALLRANSAKHRRDLRLEILEGRCVLDSTVVFNEIMYHPAGSQDNDTEWIEFHNQLRVDVDVSDWQLTGGVRFKFPDKTIVPGRGFLLVAADPQVFEAAYGQTALGPWEGRLNNRGEELKLFNNDKRLMISRTTISWAWMWMIRPTDNHLRRCEMSIHPCTSASHSK